MNPLQITYLNPNDGKPTHELSANPARAYMKYVWGDAFKFLLEDLQRYPAWRVFELMSPWLRRQNSGVWMIGSLSKGEDLALINALETFRAVAPQSSPFLYQFYPMSDPVSNLSNSLFTKMKDVYPEMQKTQQTSQAKMTGKDQTDFLALASDTEALAETAPTVVNEKKKALFNDPTLNVNLLDEISEKSKSALTAIKALFNAIKSANEEISAYLDKDQNFYFKTGSPAPLDTSLAASLVGTIFRSIGEAMGQALSAAKFYNPPARPINDTTSDTVMTPTLTKMRENLTAIKNAGAEAIRLRKAIQAGRENLNTDLTAVQTFQFKLRLFPSNVALNYPGIQFDTSIVSGSQILQVSRPRSLAGVQLANCLAVNTLDTQWLDLYATFFEHWIAKKKNPLVTLQIGEYFLEDCLLVAPPNLVNRLDVAEVFPLQFLSQITEIDKIKSLFPVQAQ